MDVDGNICIMNEHQTNICRSWLFVHQSVLLPEASFGLRVLSLPASVCVCVCVGGNHLLVRAITCRPLKLESPNLDQKSKTPWLRSPCFWGTFNRFCIYFGYIPAPASAETIVRYSVFLARTHVASSVKQNLKVVRIIHLDRGLKNSLEGSIHLKCVLKGITRMRGRAPERKLPITPVILRMFHRYIDVRNAYDVTFFAACVVAFLYVFRYIYLALKKPERSRSWEEYLSRRCGVHWAMSADFG